MDVQEATKDDERTFVLTLDPGEEVIQVLSDFTEETAIELASFTAIGGFQHASLGFFNLDTEGFDEIPFSAEQMEILSLSGEITRWDDGSPRVHGHVVVGLPDGTTRGGHLLEGVVRPILIANVVELAEHHGIDHHAPR